MAAVTIDEKAIRELIATWMQATKSGDAATVLRLLADDVVFLVAGQPPFGKDAFAKGLTAMKDVEFEGRSDIEELKVLGSWAYLRNRLEVTITPRGGRPQRRGGYTLTILRKEPDGRWVLARDANLLAPVS